jgi:hypothetical protein
MVGPQQISFGEDVLVFHLPRTLRFSLLSFNECSLFLELHLAFFFALIFLFRSYLIFISRCILTTGPCWFSSKELFQKGSNGVEKLHQKRLPLHKSSFSPATAPESLIVVLLARS